MLSISISEILGNIVENLKSPSLENNFKEMGRIA